MLARCKAFFLTGLSPFWHIFLRCRGVEVGERFTCIGRPGINRKRGSIIRLGSQVTLCNSAMANPVANEGRCRLATVAKDARLILHNGVGLSSTLICAACHVEIGENTQIGGGAMILDTDFHPRHPDGSLGTDPESVAKPVIIGKNCFIGARAIILKGVTIGDEATVGAGAVVTQDVPPQTIVGGNPTRILNSHGS